MLQALADQHDICPGLNQLLHFAHASLFELRLQLVVEEFFAQQIQAVTGHAAQDGMHRPCSKFAIGGVKKRTQHRHQEDQPTPPKAFAERSGHSR